MRRAIRETLGTTSLRRPKRFPLKSASCVVSPVTFAPGRPRLATSPAPTGSASCAMTMGIVPVACLAARLAGVPDVTITSTLAQPARPQDRGAGRFFPLQIGTQTRCSVLPRSPTRAALHAVSPRDGRDLEKENLSPRNLSARFPPSAGHGHPAATRPPHHQEAQ